MNSGSSNQRTFHFCLAGATVGNDLRLLELLKLEQQITLVTSVDRLTATPMLSTVDVLVFDCSGRGSTSFEEVRTIKNLVPGLTIILVDGNLTQPEVAQAFANGVKDYFRAPYDARLLADRVMSLGQDVRSAARYWSSQDQSVRHKA